MFFVTEKQEDSILWDDFIMWQIHKTLLTLWYVEHEAES